MSVRLVALLVLFGWYSLTSACAALPAAARDLDQAGAGKGAERRSIRDWVTCDGQSDDSVGAAKALAAAAHGAFTLVVDCPMRLQIGTDISRPLFIDDDTTIEFSGAGSLVVDNILIPAFVIANSKNITLRNWKVQYDASLPVNPIIGGHENGGKFAPGREPSPAFSEDRLTPWLAAHRAINFDGRQGRVTSLWTGSTKFCAVFFVTGDSSHLTVTGMQVGAPQAAGAERFIPVVFSLNPNFKSNQTISAKTPITAQFVAVPHDVSFSGISLDGTYMGWVGNVQSGIFENIKSARYADLQDAAGENVGGMRKWFAPPHLIYFSHYAATQDPELGNRDVRIHDVVDEGERIGRARDAAGDAPSGNALSLKIGCANCSVDHYKSNRPDGFLDLLSSDGVTISNVEATYSSAFLNNVYPGWRFPEPPYVNVTFENISLTDSADLTLRLPIGNLNPVQGIAMKNIRVHLNRWGAPVADPFPKIVGERIDISLDYSTKSDESRTVRSQYGPVELTLRGSPSLLHSGDTTVLTWSSKQATACAASGAWSGALPVNGSRSIVIRADADFNLECSNAGVTANAILHVAESN
jgi:hypothetical protein